MKTNRRSRMTGSSLVELVIIGVPLLMFMTLGIFQLILIGHARVTLNYATLMAAREGALHHAEMKALERGLAEGLAPMYGAVAAARGDFGGSGQLLTYALPEGDGYRALAAPQAEDWWSPLNPQIEGESWWNPANPVRQQARSLVGYVPAAGSDGAESLAAAAREMARIEIEQFAAISILNPTPEAFTDFARELQLTGGEMGIPNVGLYRMTGEGTQTTEVKVCKPTVTPTVNDPKAPLNPEIPSKAKLKTALLDSLAGDYWARGKYDGDVSKVHISEQFKNKISSMIDGADSSSRMGAVDLYKRIRAKASEYIQRYDSEIPDWQIDQFRSVAKMADILAKSTAGPYRPSEADLRLAVGNTGNSDSDTGGFDYGDDATEAAWENWVCGEGATYQDGTGCGGGEPKAGSVFGDIDNAFESNPEDINYSNLANRIATNTNDYMSKNIGASDGEFGGEQQAFARHVQSFFEILAKPQELGPYRHGQSCHMETVQAYGAPPVGSASGVNIQDANLLKIHVVYGYELIVPIVGPVIVEFMQQFSDPPAGGALQGTVNRIYADGRIPLTSTAVVRMQSAAFKNEAMVSRDSAFFLE